MMLKKAMLSIVAFVLRVALAQAEKNLTAADAKNYLGRTQLFVEGSQLALRSKEPRKSDVHQSR
jgi:hypothetical protein